MRYGRLVSRSHQHRPRKQSDHGHRTASRRRVNDPQSELVAMAREAARSEDPLALLMMASSLLAVFDRRRDDQANITGLIGDLVQSGDPAAAALALTIATLGGEEDLARQIRGRPRPADALPAWLMNLEPVVVMEALELSEAFGDSTTLVIRIGTGGGYELAMSVLIDHNLRGALTDAFPWDRSWARVKSRYRTFARDPDVELHQLAPANACARIAQANEHGDRQYPPHTSPTWPASQPLLEWVLSHAPPGGTGYSYPVWDDADRETFEQRFLGSVFATGFEPDDISLLESILWFAFDYGPGDPYRWSPTSVEILLLDWLPRKIVAEVDYLDRAPRVLDSLVRFSHADKGVRPALTTQTVDAINDFALEYHELVRTDRPQGPLAVLASAGWYQHESAAMETDHDWRGELALLARRESAHQVGGHHVLASLDLEPLSQPAEPWAGVADDGRASLEAIDDLCQRCAREFFDEEVGVACRLLLGDVARADLQVLHRGRPEKAAAAICWIVGRANDVLYQHRGLAVKDLLAWFGLTGSVSNRAQPMLRVLGIDPWQLSSHGSLGTDRYLSSTRRRAILSRLQRLEAPSP